MMRRLIALVFLTSSVHAATSLNGTTVLRGRVEVGVDGTIAPTATPTFTPTPTGQPTATPTPTSTPTSTPTATPTVVPGNVQINPATDLTYLGAFRVPNDNESEWSYSGNSMEFNPDGNGGAGSLFVEGFCCGSGPGHGKWAEITIPTPIINTDPNALTRATTLQAMADIASGLHDDTPTSLSMGDVLYGPSVGVASKLFWHRWTYYTPGNEQLLGCASATLSALATEGPWKIGPTQSSNFGGATVTHWLFAIPSAWATAHTGGRRIGAGRFRITASTGGLSWGPSLYAIEEGCSSAAAADAIEIARKPTTGTEWQHMSWSDDWLDATWIETGGNKAAMVVAGHKGEREYGGGEETCGYRFCGHGDGTQYYGQAQPHDCGGQGTHGSPSYGALLFYDVNTLAQAADGIIAKTVPEPYATFQFDARRYNTAQCTSLNVRLGGVAYDTVADRLYVAEMHAESIGVLNKPIVHVFAVADNPGSPDTTAPATPTGLQTTSVTSTSVALSWTASAGADAATVYIVYRDPIDQQIIAPETVAPYGGQYPPGLQPIAITTGTTWTDNLEVSSGTTYTFYVAARDAVGNTSARTAGLGVTTP